MTAKQIDNRIIKIEELKAEKKAIEEKLAKLEAEVQNEMGDNETLETARFLLRFTTFTQNRFDSSRFKKEQQALYEAYQKQLVTRRFSYAAL